MHACRNVPLVCAERRMDLGALIAARRAWQPRPSWSAIFVKAFALVAADISALRRSYIHFPWPHLYEHRISVATVNVDREFQGEETVVLAHARGPDGWPLAALDAHLRRCKEAPLASLRSFRRALRLAALPWPLRRWAMGLGLHGSGRLRERFFGTFAVTSLGAQGAGALLARGPLTVTLHYGLFDTAGQLDVRLTFDHRVFDGVIAARGLAALEATLRGQLLEELRRPASNVAA
jgi:hypothetical protein